MPIKFIRSRFRSRGAIHAARPRSPLISERLTPEHILSVELSPQHAATVGTMTRESAERLCAATRVGWAVVEDGVTLGCGGLAEVWENRAQAWTLMSPAVMSPRRFRIIHGMMQGVLDDAPWRRIEMDVDAANTAAAAWVGRLGFVREGVRRKYTVDGRDVILFARVK
ncbi:GNAT family acetyltransferase [Burkholderia sp. SCN-KJ]|uniref:GNAT family acetyltransferase n=1 Tax=Burkholderia sp. SCN-KJ TaxID=2969248 RepID=UPI00214F6C7C|nr:GNAT family acetyltransferase [Burkholderia sp. SCN-KJ]MCR4464830.1 GNAT family acetyltransferase [Burkholderia sp. SCN-KJ]